MKFRNLVKNKFNKKLKQPNSIYHRFYSYLFNRSLLLALFLKLLRYQYTLLKPCDTSFCPEDKETTSASLKN